MDRASGLPGVRALPLCRYRRPFCPARTLHRTREYGEVFGLGRKAFDTGIKEALGRLVDRLPGPLIDTLRDQWNELARLDERITRIEASLQAWMRQERGAMAISAIPGVGLLTATAAVAAMG